MILVFRGDSLKGSKEFGAQRGKEVLGEESSLNNLEKGGEETFDG